MNIFDEMPDIPPCPKCGHDDNGLNFAFPIEFQSLDQQFSQVQAACLACGFHAAARADYSAAIDAFVAGLPEEEA